jgi:hypothetical protein
MTEEELSDIDVADIPGIFLYGCGRLQIDDNGLVAGVHDPDDLTTIGTLCVLINRLTEERDTPFDGTISGLAVLAAALIAADAAGVPVPHLVGKWHKTLAVAHKLQLAANNGQHALSKRVRFS